MKKNLFLFSFIFLVAWEVFARYVNLIFIFPWPTAILKKIWILKEQLFLHHTIATLKVAFISLFFSLVLSIFLALIMDKNKKVEELVYPIIVTTQTLPTAAIGPLFVLWLGYGIWSKIFLATLMVFFPITINLHDALKDINKGYIEVFKSMNASEWDIFWKLKLPSVLPQFFSSLKMSMPYILIGAVIGEWLGASEGLGYFSRRMITQLDGAGVFAPLVLLSGIAIILVNLISLLEKKMLKWRGNK